MATTVWDGLQPLQESVTPSPVEPEESQSVEDEGGDAEESSVYVNESSNVSENSQVNSDIPELKTDVPSMDKFVKAGNY